MRPRCVGRFALAAGTIGLAALMLVLMPRPAGRPLNLVLVTLDTTRADRIGAYGDSRAAATPALDRLAREGVLFDDATSPAPLTLPAHCTILTGRLPPRHGVHDNVGRLDNVTPTLASVLRERHYRTGAFVGSVVLARSRGLSRGFETYDDRMPSTAGRPRRGAEAVVDGALEWIDRVVGSPFFAWLHFYDPHAPYGGGGAHIDTGDPQRRYEAAIASVDAQIDRFRAYLDRHDLTRHTVIVVIGDHGEGLGEHGELTHGLFVYQSVLRVPFILRAPRLAPGRRVTHPVSSADLLPTVLALLGVEAPEGLDGRALVRMLRRPVREEAPAIYAENLYVERFNWSGMRAIRSGSLKLIDKTRPELYDVLHDPGEMRDLAADQPAVVVRLAERLRSWHDMLAADAVPGRQSGALNAAETRALSSLGYVSEAPTLILAASGPSRSDPRDHVATFNCMMARLAASHPHGVAPDPTACSDRDTPPVSARP